VRVSPRYFYCLEACFISFEISDLIMVKIQKGSGSQHFVTIPEQLRKAMGWEKGDDVEFKVSNSKELKVKKS